MSTAKSGGRSWPAVVCSVMLGIVLVGLGAWFVQSDSPQSGPFECGAEIMGPGDKCVVSGSGPTESFIYEDEQATRQAWLAAWRDEPGDEIVGWCYIVLGLAGSTAVSIAAAGRRGSGIRTVLRRLGGQGEMWIVIGLLVASATATYAIWVGPVSNGPVGRSAGLGWAKGIGIATGMFTVICVLGSLRGLAAVVLTWLDGRGARRAVRGRLSAERRSP